MLTSGIEPLPVDPRLDKMFSPASIAVVGASAQPARVGARVLRFIVENGYAGRVYPVNPSRAELQGLRCYPSIDDLPEAPDLTVLAVSPAQTKDALEAIGRIGGAAAVCIAAGFREDSAEGAVLEDEIREVANRHGIIMLGPNSGGFRNFGANLFASFATDVSLGPLQGSIAVVSQSGGLAQYLGGVIAKDRGVGYRWIVDTGNEMNVDIGSVISYISQDPEVSVIGLVTEGCNDGARLRAAFETARRANKPVVALKIGRSAEGVRSAALHTGALAGADEVYDAVFRQHGVHRVRDEHEFVEALRLYDFKEVPAGRNVAVFSLTGGYATMIVDQCIDAGLGVPKLPPPTDPEVLSKLPLAVFENPLDLSGQIGSEAQLLRPVLEHVLAQPEIDSVILGFTYMLSAKHISDVFVPGIIEAARAYPNKPIVVAGTANPEAEAELRRAGISVHPMPVDAVWALAAVALGDAKPSSLEQPPVGPGTATGAVLTGADASQRLAGIPFVSSTTVATGDEAVLVADGHGYPVVMKLDGGEETHKTELGLVKVGLADAGEVRAAFADLAAAKETTGSGDVCVQPMVQGVETILGLFQDPTFGPVVMVGLGGIFVEILADVSFGLPPISQELATEMVERLRGYPLLNGARGRAPAQVSELVDAIVALSDAATQDDNAIAEVDLNPFIVGSKPGDSVAVDAVVVLRDGVAAATA